MAVSGDVAVYGAGGHTGRFVVAQLRRRGLRPILCGRDAEKLRAGAPGDAEIRVADIADAAALDRAFEGAAAVIHCAGPFLDTAMPVLDAALRARIAYLDVAAEQASARAIFERHGAAARAAGVTVVPAAAFYGGLADLLATAAMADWDGADAIDIAVALDSWKPTRGTRLTGRRNTVPRFILSGGRFQDLADPAPVRAWDFPPPFGAQEVVALPFTEIVTLAHHLNVSAIGSYMNRAPLREIGDPKTPGPAAVDAEGRSAQCFVMDVRVRKGVQERRAVARGQDIYAITGPIVAEAASRILDGRNRTQGVTTLGAMFDAAEFLAALAADGLQVERA